MVVELLRETMCVNEAMLLKLIAGDLPDAERDKVLAHLAQCDACQRLHRSLQAAWDDLGEWEAVSVLPSRDLTGDVLAAAGAESVRSRWYASARIAAAILVAAGAGWTAGRLSPHAHQGPQTVASASADEVALKVGLDALGGDSSIADSLFPVSTTDESDAGGRP